jgi:uncharacterized protein (TIGR03086 family)
MSNTEFIDRAAAPALEVVRALGPDQLAARTPCAGYDVRQLVHHLLFWGPSLEAAARKESVPPPAAAEDDLDLTDGDWAAALESHIDRTVTAWSEPDAWTGLTRMGGPNELPAPMVGVMVTGEFVVHGWDLGRAVGQRPEWDEELVSFLVRETAEIAEMGRRMGIYGPEVAVADGASALDRLLGLTGRDPAWAPA